MITQSSQAFDRHVENYDSSWDDLARVQWLRGRVLARAIQYFPAGSRILDLGCGTGQDAQLLGTLGYEVVGLDSAPKMVARAQARGVHACEGDLTMPESWPRGIFSGIFSNFGALSCVEDLGRVGQGVAERLVPGSFFLLVLIGRHCWVERLALLAQGHLGEAWRGRQDGQVRVAGLPVPVWYGGVERLSCLNPWFTVERVEGLGVLVAPPLRGSDIPRLRGRLDPMLGRCWGWRSWGDHQLIVLKRK